MKNKQFYSTIGKMKSLMERMDKNFTAYEAILNEQNKINEAIQKSRHQVTRDEILDILNKQNKNLFTSITYVTGANIAKTRKTIDIPKLSKTLEKYKERQNDSWYTSLNDFVSDEKQSKHGLSIITIVRRVLQWHTKEQYDKEYSKYKSSLGNLRMKYGAGIATDGTLGDNKNQRVTYDGNPDVTVNQTQNLAKDINDIHTINKTAKCYIIDSKTGDIISEIPNDVMMALQSATKIQNKIEKDVNDAISLKNISEDEKEALRQEYLKEKAELDKEFKGRNLLFDKILCICGSVDHQSYYYINDLVVNKIATKSEINVNQQQLVEIAKEQLGESFDVIQGFEK